MPAAFAALMSAGVRAGLRYNVIRYSTSGSMACSWARYSMACATVLMGGVRLG